MRRALGTVRGQGSKRRSIRGVGGSGCLRTREAIRGVGGRACLYTGGWRSQGAGQAYVGWPLLSHSQAPTSPYKPLPQSQLLPSALPCPAYLPHQCIEQAHKGARLGVLLLAGLNLVELGDQVQSGGGAGGGGQVRGDQVSVGGERLWVGRARAETISQSVSRYPASRPQSKAACGQAR